MTSVARELALAAALILTGCASSSSSRGGEAKKKTRPTRPLSAVEVSPPSLMVAKKKDPFQPVLATPDEKLQSFAICGADQKWHWADARIEGNTIKVSSPAVAEPVAVRYAYRSNPAKANLYNKEGLPAIPFRTDKWNP